MTQNSDETKEINKPKEGQAPPEAVQRSGVIGETVNQAKWRQTQQQHILEQGESATDLFYDPNFKPKDKSAKFELVDDAKGKSGSFIDYKPQKLDKKTFALGMDHENEPRSAIQKLSDFVDAAARRASDPAGQQKYIQGELDKIAGIGRGLNTAKEHTKASVAAGWTALTDGTVAKFLSKPNAINDPLFHAVGGVLDAASKDPHAVDKAIGKVGEIILISSERYSKLPQGKQGEVLGEVLFASFNPEGSTEAGQLLLKATDRFATHVDKTVFDGITKAMRAADNLAETAPALAEQSRQMVREYMQKLKLTPQELQYEGVPSRYVEELKPVNDNVLMMKGKSHDFVKNLDGLDKIDDLRLQHGVPHKRNIAFAEVDIAEQETQLVAVSGERAPGDTVGLPEVRKFKPIPIGFDLRDNHSELKILERIAEKANEFTRGTVKIYTEREPCASCEDVVRQFREMFQGITVRVEYGFDR